MTRTLAQIYTSYSDYDLKAAELIDAATLHENSQKYHSDSCGSCRMIHHGSDSCIIPDAPYYVCSNDPFFSGWGHAENVTNVCVVPCASMWEAREVVGYIERRDDQKRIRIVQNKPRPRGRKLSLLLSWRYNALNADEPRPERE